MPHEIDRAMLKAPHWGRNVVTYLFFGGIMGGLSVLALLADPAREDERRMRTTARFAALALAALNPILLISHLGRPERFFMMLRIAKLKSPMSLGVWGLLLFSGAAGANVVDDLAQSKALPTWMRHFAPPPVGFAQGILGAFVAGYTGVLLSATAVPLWGAGKRHIPAASVCSGFAGACALLSLASAIGGSRRIAHKLERLEMIAGIAELAILYDFKRTAGSHGKPMFEGARGARLRAYTLQAGLLAPLVLNLFGTFVKLPKPLDALRTTIASLLSLFGGYILRETLIEAGKDSTRELAGAYRQPT